jgi:leucyl aminopeptidase
MTASLEVRFASLQSPLTGTVVLFAGPETALAPRLAALDRESGGLVRKAAEAADFTGRAKSAIELLAPQGLQVSRMIVLGAGKDLTELDRLALGGASYAQIAARKTDAASVVGELHEVPAAHAAELAADIGYGALLRSYAFRKYRTRSGGRNGRNGAGGNGADGDNGGAGEGLATLTILSARPDQAADLFRARRAVADGVFLARDLVNEPANVLGPEEFAARARDLSSHGLEVEVLDVAAMAELGMGALLGVGQGSARPSRLVVMQWHGAKSKRVKPLCFCGKGVVFDTGGISIKPAQGMEDMKGDMGGAACVTGLMLALAGRRAPVNAVGLIGLVENMPSASAQRPGDIVTSMSGQTIEVINTDAEGRLVLADVLWYAQERFKPRFIIDLATLTGAIMVALGKEHAGLFANDDRLAADIARAGEATGEKVWRMPLGKAYDKMIDSRFADMKNTGGRFGGAITAAQFLQRFIKDTPWAHLDVAGTAMDSVKTDTNTSWGSGWGVRLLDRLIADTCEKGER